jgi:hypothetical protein
LQATQRLNRLECKTSLTDPFVLCSKLELRLIVERDTVVVRNSGEFLVCKLNATVAYHVDLVFVDSLKKFNRLSLKERPLNLRAEGINHVYIEKLTTAISILP